MSLLLHSDLSWQSWPLMSVCRINDITTMVVSLGEAEFLSEKQLGHYLKVSLLLSQIAPPHG